MLKNKKTSKKRNIIICSVIAVLVVASFVAYFSLKSEKTTVLDDPSKINYSPPTEEEKDAADKQKQEVVDREKTEQEFEDNETANPGVINNAEIILSSAAQYGSVIEVRGYVANIYEDGGTCQATFTKGGDVVKQQSAAFKDAKTVQCGALDTPRSMFGSSGEWQVALEYISTSATGKTESKKITIQ